MSSNHINRLAHGVCTADVGALYLALTSNVERISDHFINVADGLLPLINKAERHTIKDIKLEVKGEFKSAEESANVFLSLDNTDANSDIQVAVDDEIQPVETQDVEHDELVG